MTREGRKRFCAECKKHVHDLSRMTAADARALLDAPATEGLCIRYVYDAEGRVVFDAPIPEASLLQKAKRFATGAVALALPMSLNACMGAYAPPKASPAATATSTPAATPAATPTATPTATSSPTSTPTAIAVPPTPHP